MVMDQISEAIEIINDTISKNLLNDNQISEFQESLEYFQSLEGVSQEQKDNIATTLKEFNGFIESGDRSVDVLFQNSEFTTHLDQFVDYLKRDPDGLEQDLSIDHNKFEKNIGALLAELSSGITKEEFQAFIAHLSEISGAIKSTKLEALKEAHAELHNDLEFAIPKGMEKDIIAQQLLADAANNLKDAMVKRQNTDTPSPNVYDVGIKSVVDLDNALAVYIANLEAEETAGIDLAADDPRSSIVDVNEPLHPKPSPVNTPEGMPSIMV